MSSPPEVESVTREWQRICVACLAEFDRYVANAHRRHAALAAWCELCEAAADALNCREYFLDDDVASLNGTPMN